MNKWKKWGMPKLALAGGLGLMLGLGGCAPMQTRSGSPQQAGGGCNMGTAALIGGVLGSLAGKGKGHLVGAAVGAGLGALACSAYNYRVAKVRDAEQVNADYRHQHGALPTQNTVSLYASTLQPGETVQAGSAVSLQSTIGVVQGTQDVAPEISETLTLISPAGKELASITKQAKSISGSGEYRTDFEFDLPKGVKHGQYQVHTQLLMDGKPVRDNKTPMLVVG